MKGIKNNPHLEAQQCLGLGLPPAFRVLENNPYLEAYQCLDLGLLPVSRSTPILRFRVATSIQKHTSVSV